MGNEQSQISGLEVEEKAVEVTDFWTHHSAIVNSGNLTNLSIFIGEPLIGGSLWITQTPLEKSSKNLMLHRHPCILKYVSSWHKGSKFYLAVEDVKPLSHVLATQNTLQICIGLHSILKALGFLHNNAHASHNNVCTASIYVTKDGSWKLGGMEYLTKFEELSLDYLNKAKVHRYDKAIDPNEEAYMQQSDYYDFIDSYAFSILILEIFKKRSDDDIICLTSFKEYCKNELQNSNVILRPKLSALLDHSFFNHEFIKIYSFLTELPLKSDIDKTQFFVNLHSKLKTFDEQTVGNLLAGLLLSRMVLLNKTAQEELVPYLLSPRQDTEHSNSEGLFSIENFQTYIIPKLLEIMCVRDAQIRLLLLNHFRHFLKCFTKEQLQLQILPELLVGIKDTNDHLVSVTLRTLADLVPILGSAVVIGGKRAKLFNDGRPIVHTTRPRSRRNSRRNQEITATNETDGYQAMEMNNINTVLLQHSNIMTLPERPSPDGEENETTTEEVEQSADELENWEDWDINEDQETLSNTNMNAGSTNNLLLLESSFEQGSNIYEPELDLPMQNLDINNSSNANQRKSLPDIFELDIKNQRNNFEKTDEIDFFQDMEPIIDTSNVFLVNINEDIMKEKPNHLDLSVKGTEEHHVDGWGDDSDWE